MRPDPAPASARVAQEAADRIRIVREELSGKELRDVLALTPEQSGRFDEWCVARLTELSTQFDVDTTDSQKRMSWGMRIASSLGGIAICAAILLFFARYWGYLGTPAQVIVVMSAPLAALAATEYASRRERTLYFTGLLGLVTLALFGLNLGVLGDIFNIASTQNALLAWGALAVLLAYRYGLRVLLWLGISLVVSYCAATFTASLGYRWLDFGTRPEHFIVLGIAVFAVPLVIGQRNHFEFDAIYRLAGVLIVLSGVLALAEFGAHSYLPFTEKTIERSYEIAGLFVSAGAIWLGVRREWNGIVNWATVFFIIFLFTRLCRWWWDWMPHYVFFGVIGLIGIALVAGFRRLRGRTLPVEGGVA